MQLLQSKVNTKTEAHDTTCKVALASSEELVSDISPNKNAINTSCNISFKSLVGSQGPRKNLGSHIDASHSRQPLVKGERLVRYEVNAVMLLHALPTRSATVSTGAAPCVTKRIAPKMCLVTLRHGLNLHAHAHYEVCHLHIRVGPQVADRIPGAR